MIETPRTVIDTLLRTVRLVGRLQKNQADSSPSQQLYYKMLDKYFSNVLNAKQQNGFLASHTIFFPVEILYAMGITPLHNEVTTWTTGMLLGNQMDFLNAGAEAGLAPEICSPHRGLAGGYFKGLLPKPDVVLWSNLICDNTAKSGEYISAMTGAPGFFLDHPFDGSPLENQYLQAELKDLIVFLEKTSGRKMDWARLSQSVAAMDQQIKLQTEIAELRQARPSPFPSRRFLELLTIDYMFAGQPEATEYLTALKNELAEKVQKGIGVVKPEKYRLMTLFIPPIHLLPFLEDLFRENGAVSVVEPLFTFWRYEPLDPEQPLASIARKSFIIPEARTMYGPFGETTLQEIRDRAREYQVDGAIYYAFIGCRHACATIKVIKDLLNQMDIPVLTMDCDIADPTVNHKTEVRQKMEQFFELLEDR
jgi:benzoyl-CoA reductase/2-hydroxyglutaryl-CoA dehydratase subunit BcrC/BadD/HgdB